MHDQTCEARDLLWQRRLGALADEFGYPGGMRCLGASQVPRCATFSLHFRRPRKVLFLDRFMLHLDRQLISYLEVSNQPKPFAKVIAQAKAEQGIANWIALELRHSAEMAQAWRCSGQTSNWTSKVDRYGSQTASVLLGDSSMILTCCSITIV